jgi:hypothetical protein
MRAGADVRDDFRILGIWDGQFEDSDDGSRPAAKANRFADDGRIFLKCGRPETVRENDNAGSVRTVILRADETAEDRV